MYTRLTFQVSRSFLLEKKTKGISSRLFFSFIAALIYFSSFSFFASKTLDSEFRIRKLETERKGGLTTIIIS